MRPLLDGRFLLEEGVGLWEWRYPFPLEGEAVVVLDLETTGLAPGLDEVIEVGLLRLEGGRRLPFQSLVRPSRPPSPFVERLTGIPREALEEAPVVRRVDLVDLAEAEPAFRERVLREGVLWAEF